MFKVGDLVHFYNLPNELGVVIDVKDKPMYKYVVCFLHNNFTFAYSEMELKKVS